MRDVCVRVCVCWGGGARTNETTYGTQWFIMVSVFLDSRPWPVRVTLIAYSRVRRLSTTVRFYLYSYVSYSGTRVQHADSFRIVRKLSILSRRTFEILTRGDGPGRLGTISAIILHGPANSVVRNVDGSGIAHYRAIRPKVDFYAAPVLRNNRRDNCAATVRIIIIARSYRPRTTASTRAHTSSSFRNKLGRATNASDINNKGVVRIIARLIANTSERPRTFYGKNRNDLDVIIIVA